MKGVSTMVIKQLEYFVSAADEGSLNRAAEHLYTSQPHVSQVIASLETELDTKLFHRSHRGIRLTDSGRKLYDYAKLILQNVKVMTTIAQKKHTKKLSISSYPSSMITRLLIDLYKSNRDEEFHLEYHEGTVEEITDNISNFVSEFGIVYVAEKQVQCFNHILGHKRLRFVPICKKEMCVYVGSQHPFYNRDSIDFNELSDLKFVQGTKDFFAMEHHLDSVSLGIIQTEKLKHVIHSNSTHMTLNVLLHTDICSIGINIMTEEYKQYDIKALKINNCNPFLVIGYVLGNNDLLSVEGEMFIEKLNSMLKPEVINQ
jgi:DNA-binding transcriptional LysR family regulator